MGPGGGDEGFCAKAEQVAAMTTPRTAEMQDLLHMNKMLLFWGELERSSIIAQGKWNLLRAKDDVYSKYRMIYPSSN
jgi:hypothetical protein